MASLVAKGLLFFHPVAHRLHARLDVEREFACDDRAAETCGPAASYARTLAALERARPGRSLPGMAANGAPLLARVRRLVAPRPRLKERSARTRAWGSAAAIVLLAFAVTRTPHPAGPTLPMAIARALVPQTHPDDNTRIQIKDVRGQHHH